MENGAIAMSKQPAVVDARGQTKEVHPGAHRIR